MSIRTIATIAITAAISELCAKAIGGVALENEKLRVTIIADKERIFRVS